MRSPISGRRNRDGPQNALAPAPAKGWREGSSMGQKTVRFSDLSGQLIMDDAEALERAALRVAVVDLYLPDDIEPRRIVMEADAFDKLATENSMEELLIAARPVRRSPKTSVNGGSRGDRLDYGTLEHAG